MAAGELEHLNSLVFHLNFVNCESAEMADLDGEQRCSPLQSWGRQASTGACIDLWMHVGLFVGELVKKTCKTQMLIKN